MKKLFVLLVMVSSVMGAELNFNCEGPSESYFFKFDASGTISLENELSEQGTMSSAVFSADLTDAGLDAQSVELNNIEAKGETKEVSIMTVEPFVFSALKFELNGERYVLKLLNDFPNKNASMLINVDTGATYKSNCKIVD